MSLTFNSACCLDIIVSKAQLSLVTQRTIHEYVVADTFRTSELMTTTVRHAIVHIYVPLLYECITIIQ